MSGAGPSVKHYVHITFLYIKTIRTVIREDFFCTQSAEAAMRQVCREEQEVISVQAELWIRFRTILRSMQAGPRPGRHSAKPKTYGRKRHRPMMPRLVSTGDSSGNGHPHPGRRKALTRSCRRQLVCSSGFRDFRRERHQ